MMRRLIGVGHHPLSKKLEFNGFCDDICPCLIATDYKAPKCVLEDWSITKRTIIYDDFNSRIKADQSVIGTLTTNIGSSTPRTGTKIIEEEGDSMRIRKLTPRECWRLMGFSDEDFEKAEKVSSNSQLYKQAGNSIVVNVLEELLSRLFDEERHGGEVKLLSLFSGIGAFEKALKNLGVNCDLVGYCEIDKYASKSYAAVHEIPEDMNLGDVAKIDVSMLPRGIDLITYGFPCQDISSAGKQRGFTNGDGSLTRSGLFFEALRVIEGTKPKFAITENVKNLISKKFSEQFNIVLSSLEEAGYNNYWRVLNAKNYGIPQSRERVFIVSIRKDIDTGSFEFPEPFPLKKRLTDMLEDEVDEKFYLSDEQVQKIINWRAQQKPLEHVLGSNSICPTITARGAGENHSGMILLSDELQETTDLQQSITACTKVGIDKSSNKPQTIDIANCITAREDRGVSNRGGEGTAILEIKRTMKEGRADGDD